MTDSDIYEDETEFSPTRGRRSRKKSAFVATISKDSVSTQELDELFVEFAE